MKLAVIMLAAGNSRRFGSNKLLHLLEGVPMYQRGLETVLEAGRRLREESVEVSFTVVTQYEEIQEYAEGKGIRTFWNPHPEDGISSSLQIGLSENREADACLFTVADQPWLTAETVTGLVRAYLESGKGMACLSFGDASGQRLGNPCIFSKKYYEALFALNGDVGGKRVLAAHREEAEIFVINDRKELEDIDFSAEAGYTEVSYK